MDNKLVSVIIPAYNHEKYIQQTIKSIINQSYKTIELIIIDDGSKDSTFAKIKEMETECKNRFTRFEYTAQKNMGTCITLNRLLSKCNGEYIYLIASDDIAKPNAIEKEVCFLEKNPEYGLCVGDNELIDSDGKICFFDKNNNLIYKSNKNTYNTFAALLQKRKKFKFTDSKFGTYKSLHGGNYIPNGYIIRKAALNGIVFKKEAPLEDYYLMLQISKKYKMKYLDEILFSYRQHSNNTVSNHQKMIQMEKKTIEYESTILENIDKENVFDEVKEVKKNGVLYKSQGIPFIFEIKSYLKFTKKLKVIKLFNIKISEIEKERF